MSQTAREQKRTDVMLQSAKETVAPAQSDGILDRVPGRYREMLGELRALAAMSDLCRLAAIKRVQDLKAWCIAHRVSWEEVCDAALPKCRRTIDRYLDTLETFGDGSYEGILEVTSHAERVQARRLLKSGTIRHEDGAIVISGKRIPNDAAHTDQIVEVLREAFAQAEAAKTEAAQEKKLRQSHQEASQKLLGNQHALIERQKAEIRSLRELPAPEELQSTEERESWRAAREALEVCGLRIASLVGLIHKDGVTDAFRARIIGQLRAMQTWLNTAILEAAEALPPDIDLPIELERQACAISATLTDGQLGAVRQYVAAKAALVSGSEQNGDRHAAA